MCAFTRYTHDFCFQYVVSHQPVYEGALAHSRRPDEAIRLAWFYERTKAIESRPCSIADRNNLGCNPRPSYVQHLAVDFIRSHQVCFTQYDDWFYSAVATCNKVAVQSAYVEIVVARLDDEGNVDVRGNHLEIDDLAGALATKE